VTSLPADALTDFAAAVLRGAGLSGPDASVVAESLVAADLRGVASHGVGRLGQYLARIEHGVMVADADIRIAHDMPAAALLDAGNGFGQLAATRAMEIAISKAGAVGIGAVSVANSNHFGIAGLYAEQAAAAGLIGIVMTNASPAMAPFNTSERMLGTNPLAVGIPAGPHPAIVLDMSSSLVARGKIRAAHRRGDSEIPEGWAYDSSGHATTDPGVALDGLLAPVGGAKGAGLSLVIDLLSGALSGSGAGGEVTNITDVSRPSGTGHLMIALNPAAFVGREAFERSTAEIVARIHSLPAADGGSVYLPGELENQRMTDSVASGISLNITVLAELEGLAAKYGVAPVRRLAER
jgi:LDH2 family malate/lactate/ureidoglycolate dehydrogenase